MYDRLCVAGTPTNIRDTGLAPHAAFVGAVLLTGEQHSFLESAVVVVRLDIYVSAAVHLISSNVAPTEPTFLEAIQLTTARSNLSYVFRLPDNNVAAANLSGRERWVPCSANGVRWLQISFIGY